MSSTTMMRNKDYIICDYSEGLDVTQLASLNAKSLFSSSIQDVELMRELLAEAAHYNGTHGFYQFDQLAQSLDWKARGLPPNTTTVEALNSYVDDRADRRMERFSPLNGWDPLVGNKQSDMRFAESLALILPWIVDRSSRETSWWKYHQSGRSEGRFKEPFRFDKFYAAAWLGMYSETLAYYPPLNVYGEGLPLTIADIVGDNFTAREAPYYKPAVPENNPKREALFSVPYPDDAQPGRAVISAIAPVYYTGNFSGFYYDDTFMGVLGVDIEVDSVSHFLDALQGTVAPTSFSMLVDADFNTIVISRNTTSRIYPERTGMEPERVSYDINGNVISDRRNATYLPSDTMLQDLTKLQSAKWTFLLEKIRNEPRGGNGYTTLNITFTGETNPRQYYVWFDGWEYVANWYLLVFAPKDEVDTAVQVSAGPRTLAIAGDQESSEVIALHASKGDIATGQGIIVNNGRVDMYLSPEKIPQGVTLLATTGARNSVNGSDGENNPWPYLLRAGQSLPIDFQLETQSLPIGTKMDYMVFQLRDADYPDCHHNSDVALSLSIQVQAQNCTDSSRVLSDYGICVCPAGTVLIAGSCANVTILTCSIVIPFIVFIALNVYFHGLVTRKKADAVWEVKPSDLKIGKTPVILGEGTFGLVVLAEYRGTQVAVKRVLPRKKSGKGGPDSSNRDPFGSNAVQSLMLSKFLKDPIATGTTNATPIVPPVHSSLQNAEDEDYGYQDEVDMEGGHAKSKGSSWFKLSIVQEKLPALSSEDPNKNQKERISLGSGRSSNQWDHKLKKEFIKEMRFVSKLRHPCIITVMGAVIDPREEPLLVLEYMENGSLHDLLHNHSMQLEGDLILSVLRDISQGILYLHKMEPPLIHGDLKSPNILIDTCFRSRVSDFGLSRGRQFGKKKAVGTPYWMSPELLRGESSNTERSDIFAFGIVLWEIYARKDPYEGEECTVVFREVCDPKVNKRPPAPPAMPPLVASLMHDCLVTTPEDRPTFDEIANRIKRFTIDDVHPVGLRRNDGRDFDLLLKVFPRHIADALRDGRRVEPEHHDCITCFFSDIVSFTTISGSITPSKVSDMLHRLFSKMDSLADKLGVFKVETIGDAWMGVTNCVQKQENDHVKRIAEFAMGAVKAAHETLIDEENPSMGTVSIRVGFHCGPVVATVVGNVAPHFTLIGDTINTSSRMESNSEPGKIHLSQVAADLLHEQAPHIRTICRGEMQIKGKGAMTTYFLLDVAEEE